MYFNILGIFQCIWIFFIFFYICLMQIAINCNLKYRSYFCALSSSNSTNIVWPPAAAMCRGSAEHWGENDRSPRNQIDIFLNKLSIVCYRSHWYRLILDRHTTHYLSNGHYVRCSYCRNSHHAFFCRIAQA